MQSAASDAAPRLSYSPWFRLLLRDRSPLSIGVLIVGSSAVGVYFVLPGTAQNALFVSFGSLAAVFLVYGAVRNAEGRDRIPWYLIAVSQAVFSVGDGVINFYPNVVGHAAACA